MGEAVARKRKARERVNVAVRLGRLPRPNALPCTDCGHVWARGERRHEYDHHQGYSVVHELDVQPVCSTCHAARRHNVPACKRGHAWTTTNTIARGDGRRACRQCRRDKESRVRTASWWRAWRARKAAA